MQSPRPTGAHPPDIQARINHNLVPLYPAHDDGTPSVPPILPVSMDTSHIDDAARYLRMGLPGQRRQPRRAYTVHPENTVYRPGTAPQSPDVPIRQSAEEKRLQKLMDDRIAAGLVDG